MILENATFLNELEELNLPKDDFALYGTYPLAIRGIKDCVDDIDVVVKKGLWNKLVTKYPVVVKDFGNEVRGFIIIGNIEICYSMVAFYEDSEKVIERADIISGYRFVNLEDTMFWKRHLNRDKDIKDIELIEQYLKEK